MPRALDAVARGRALDERPPGAGRRRRRRHPSAAARRWARDSGRPPWWPAARRRMSERTPARAARRSLRLARMVASSVLQVPTSFSAVRSSAARACRPVGELPLGGLDGAHDISVAAGDGAHHGELCDEVAEVGGAEDGVHRRDVLVLVHRHGPRRQGGAGEAELLVGEALEPAVLRELTAHRLECPRGARVAGDGGADLRVERGDLRGELAGLGPVLLQRPRARARGSDGHGEHARGHTQSRAGRPAPDDVSGGSRAVRLLERRADDRSLLVPDARVRLGAKGQSRNLALGKAQLKRRNRGVGGDVRIRNAIPAVMAVSADHLPHSMAHPAKIRDPARSRRG